jgi:16S rRNA (uracil1498-N3)-methyltransferase
LTPPLFLLDELPDGDEVALTGDEGRHAARVRRIGAGEAVLVGDGRGTLLRCTVQAVDADALSLCVETRTAVPAADPRLVVVQALPKGDRAELAVELLTELGVDEIVPWAASRSVAVWQGQRGERARQKWQRTAREAAKQSRRAWVPGVAAPASTADVAARLRHATPLVLHEAAAVPLSAVRLPDAGEIVVVVGPEGGITEQELTAFAATPVRLGAPVLRTSTAGAAALAVLSARLGRWA